MTIKLTSNCRWDFKTWPTIFFYCHNFFSLLKILLHTFSISPFFSSFFLQKKCKHDSVNLPKHFWTCLTFTPNLPHCPPDSPSAAITSDKCNFISWSIKSPNSLISSFHLVQDDPGAGVSAAVNGISQLHKLAALLWCVRWWVQALGAAERTSFSSSDGVRS